MFFFLKFKNILAEVLSSIAFNTLFQTLKKGPYCINSGASDSIYWEGNALSQVFSQMFMLIHLNVHQIKIKDQIISS